MQAENQPINNSQSSLNGIDSSRRMHGWFKLMETIRKTDPPSNQRIRSLSNSNSANNFNRNSLTQQPNSYERSFPLPINTNGHILKSSETTNTLDSPPNIFNSPSIVSLASTPGQIIEDIPVIEPVLPSTPGLRRENIPLVELDAVTSISSPESSDSNLPSTRPKKIIRKSNKSKGTPLSTRSMDLSTPMTEDISDDDMPLIDIRKPKTKSIDALSTPLTNDSIIPLATDLQSLPGHIQDELRDIRFLTYSDIDTLSLHLQTCLYIDKKSSLSTKQYILKTRYNVLYKIFKIYFLKTFRKNVCLEKKSVFNKKDHQKQQTLSMISSPTSTSFKSDWTFNRRHSASTHKHKPGNIFHALQLNPKVDFSLRNASSISISKSPVQNFERIKDILARTYYPHLYTAVEYGCHFGAKSRFPNTQQLISFHDDIPIKEMPQSPHFMDDSGTITLKSPPSTTRPELLFNHQSPIVTKQPERKEKNSKTNERRISKEIDELSPIVTKQPERKEKNSKINERRMSKAIDELSPIVTKQPERKEKNSKTNEHRMSKDINELSSIVLKKSIVVLTPTHIPLPSRPSTDKEKKSNNNRKRKSSSTTNTNIKLKKKKRVLSPQSPEINNQIEDVTNSESEEDVLPSQLPKQTFIKNGLRSNYYKTKTDTTSKSTSNKNRPERRRRQSSGTLPPFYTGIFEVDDDESPSIDYCLPYDVYWYGQQKAKETTVIPSSSPLPSSTSTFQHKKKKSSKPKQKQPSPYKKILRNTYTDQIRQNLLSSYSTEKAPVCDCKPPGTCEDGICFNRKIYTECLTSCACGIKCSNQKIRKSQWCKHLEIFDTTKYGQGVRTTAPIPKGTFLCEYVGEIITDEKFHERMTNIYSKDEHHYTMKLTQNLVIDAYRMGSIARFANHSCLPNCEIQKWTVDGLQRMCIFSARSIKAGEEITYDYNFQCFNSEAQQPCYCESSKCRGTIGAKQQTSSPSLTNNNTNNHHATTAQKLTQREKRMVLQSSIFLFRNLRRIKEKQELRRKNSNKQKQQTDKQSAITLFYPQNFYHSNGSNNKSTIASLRKTPKLTHKDIFYLFYNHIRQSHFAKSGRYHYELIDNTCFYAQLSQLTLILNEIFELILYYRCTNEDIAPSMVIKKCPSKRLFPTYYEIITKPIDLVMMRNKLENGEYLSFHLFEQDLLLLVKNAISYCGKDSEEARVVLELQDYFLNTLKNEYKDRLNLFINMKEKNRNLTSLQTFENFITNLHEKEVIDGQVREVLYDIIYNIDENSEDNDSPIVYKIVLANNINSHRTLRSRTSSDCIVHCRCGSVYDENSLVQCYACQLWQHIACVSIVDPSRPYYCFECQPTCEYNPSSCLKTNVLITATLAPLQTYDDNHCSYSTLTRSDGFTIRVNECYFVPKQDENNIDKSLTSPEYDILYIERLWLDDFGIGQASGFYYIRPNETFHEPNRKFFPNEVFRFPASNDPLPISSIVRPCFVLDIGTYCKGKPISDNTPRVSSNDLFICEYRVDKLARTFTRVPRARHFNINTKPYCFDYYVEKLTIKRDYQPYQKEVQQQHHDNRRRLAGNSNKLNNKQIKEKKIRINGIIEKIYHRYHHKNLMPNEKKYSINQILQQSFTTSPALIDETNHRNNSPGKRKIVSVSSSIHSPVESPAGNINRKRRTISLSSDDDIVELVPENICHRILKKRSKKQTVISPRKRDELIDQI